jgi:hypothetical protein
MEMRFAVEWRINWQSGKARIASAPGKNMRFAQSLIAVSNLGEIN